MSKLTHLDERGKAQMVDVGAKEPTGRRALARGHVTVKRELLTDLVDGNVPKGDVLAAARIAGILAAKKTPELIPLCHTLNLSSVNIGFEVDAEAQMLHIFADARAMDRTGVEMEALTAVMIASLTIYDMLKSADRSMTIGGVELVRKEGGRSGDYNRTLDVVLPPSIPPQPLLPIDLPSPDISEDLEESLASLLEPPKNGQGSNPAPSVAPLVLERAASVKRLRGDEPDLISLLTRDPVASAYMLGDLAKPYAEHCEWYALGEDGSQIESVLLLYTGLRMPAVLAKGKTADIKALVEAARSDLPRRFYCHVRAEHISAFEPSFIVNRPKEMSRMGLRKEDFAGAGDVSDVEALTHRDTGAIMQVYQHYPDNFFEPAQLGTGLYFGVKDGETLLSVAGIHVMSEVYDVAAIGNIVTLPDLRGQGLATRCVGRLLEALFDRVGHVALNVERANEPAIASYTKFGFRHSYPFVEGWAESR